MSSNKKNQAEILQKLRIEQLNPMQEEAHLAINSLPEVILLSPTGTGKTLAFLLPLMQAFDENSTAVQALILAPSRELAIQIETVAREMGTGYKTNAVYGGRPISKDKIELSHPPALLIGTPGRVAHHLRRGTFDNSKIKTIILDEFDKSLEIGFEDDMKEIMSFLPALEKKILTSATNEVDIPRFVGLSNPKTIDFLEGHDSQLELKVIYSPIKDKLQTLFDAITHMGNQPGIVFCNFKDSIQRVSDFLKDKGIAHGCFYGGLEQQDRERALIKFRNGTHQVLLATDLAARGLDIPEIKFIIHYHLPTRSHEFTHRNGRTARMNKDGTAYILLWEQEQLPDFIQEVGVQPLGTEQREPKQSPWQTLFISGGRKDKISKGDIAGLFFKQGKLDKNQLGIIELKQDCAFVAIHKSIAQKTIQQLDNSRLKKKKVRIKLI